MMMMMIEAFVDDKCRCYIVWNVSFNVIELNVGEILN